MDAFAGVASSLLGEDVRFLVIGVWGINYYARSGVPLFTTEDRDIFLPPDAKNLHRAWNTCEKEGLQLRAGTEPLDSPRDLVLARAVVDRRAATIATDDRGLHVDLTLTMAGFDFEDVWQRQRSFRVDHIEIPVARLSDIVTSKARAGREKDRLFLATHADQLEQLLELERGS